MDSHTKKKKVNFNKWNQMYPRGRCYYVMVSFYASAHTVHSSEPHNVLSRRTNCDTILVAQFQMKSPFRIRMRQINKACMCGMNCSPAAQCFFSLSLIEWISSKLNVPPAILLNCLFGRKPKPEAKPLSELH